MAASHEALGPLMKHSFSSIPACSAVKAVRREPYRRGLFSIARAFRPVPVKRTNIHYKLPGVIDSLFGL